MFKAIVIILLLFITGLCMATLRLQYENTIAPFDYQIQVMQDSAFIYRDNQFLGTTYYGYGGIDSVILKDLQ